MKIKNWMNKNVKTSKKEDTILQATREMKNNFVSDLVVIDNGSPIGMITERDIVYKVVAMEKTPSETKVEDVMTKTLITANLNDSVTEVSRRMGLAKIKQIPVVDGNNSLVGIVTSTDLIRVVSHFQKNMEAIIGK